MSPSNPAWAETIKRWFLRGYLTLLCVLAAVAGYALMHTRTGTGMGTGAAGLLLAVTAPLAFFAWLRVKRPPRTDPHPILVSVVSGLGAITAMGAVYRYGDGLQPFLMGAVVSLAGWQIYLRWSSQLPRPKGAPTSGQPLPLLNLVDLEGQAVSNASLIGHSAVLLFYRSNGSPFCAAQVDELVHEWQKLARADVQLWLISSQPQLQSRALDGRFPTSARFLRDPGNRAAQTLGIRVPEAAPTGAMLPGDSAQAILPTVVVVDTEGVIRFIASAENDRLRPDPATYLGALEPARR